MSRSRIGTSIVSLHAYAMPCHGDWLLAGVNFAVKKWCTLLTTEK